MTDSRDESPGTICNSAHTGSLPRDSTQRSIPPTRAPSPRPADDRGAGDASDFARLRSATTMAAHEIGNSSLVIAGFARRLTEERSDLEEETIDSMLASIIEHAHIIEQVKTDLTAAASPQRHTRSITIQSLPLRPKLEAATACLPRSTRASITCPPGLRVRADPIRLQQILTNLLSNADKYGGPPIHVIAEPRGTHIEISIIDHGPGIDEEFRSDLFQAHTRANAGNVAGSGLGLHVVTTLAEAHGGQVWFAPTPGGGATFTFTLPA